MSDVELRAATNVTGDPITRNETPIVVRTLLMLVGAVAVLAGLYGRFKGIGTWPLGVEAAGKIDWKFFCRAEPTALASWPAASTSPGSFWRGWTW